MRRRWRGRARVAPLTPTLRAYLKGGFDAMLAEAADLEVYQLAGQVMNGHVDELRELWDTHAAEIKSGHPGLTFAEYQLREVYRNSGLPQPRRRAARPQARTRRENDQ